MFQLKTQQSIIALSVLNAHFINSTAWQHHYKQAAKNQSQG